jgi:inward rectifier potassium channel
MARPVRRQRIDLGGLHAVKHGAPWGKGDLYYELMEMGWRRFIAFVTVVFCGVNLLYGAIYAALPAGAIEHMPPGSIEDGFFFSVETLATVGYGNMAPATHLGHIVAVVEILTGLFLTAALTGLIFQRFARPQDSLIFSDKLVVVRIGDRRLAMVRLAGTRARPLADVTASMALLEAVVLPTGRRYAQQVDLPLRNTRNAMMALAWTLVHVVDDASPLAKVIDDPAQNIRITVTIRGLDTLLSNPSFGSHIYTRADICIDEEFVDIFDNRDDGSIHLDLTQLHATRPATDPFAGGVIAGAPPAG